MNNIIDLISSNTVVIILLIIIIETSIVYFLIIDKIKQQNISSEFSNLFLKIREITLNSISPKFIKLSPKASDLVDLAVEVWRVEKRLNKLLLKSTDSQKAGFENSIQRIKRYLNKNDIEVIDYTGQKYNEGLGLDILSIDNKSEISNSFIKETIEPTVLCKNKLARKAKIVLQGKK